MRCGMLMLMLLLGGPTPGVCRAVERRWVMVAWWVALGCGAAGRRAPGGGGAGKGTAAGKGAVMRKVGGW